ncbi:hypothetical protein NUSPORA_00754 [Nucleospora cyclopteri]
MLIKLLWCLTTKNNSFQQTIINDKQSEISLYFQNTQFLKTFFPKFFNFTEPLMHKNFILHCQKLITKTIEKNFFKFSIQEYYLNKEKTNNNVNCFIINVKSLKLNFLIDFNPINYFQRIELHIFEFVLQKISAIKVLNNDNRFFNKILEENINFLIKLTRKLTRANCLLLKKSKSSFFIDTNIINIIKELNVCLTNIKNDKKEELYISQLFYESYIKYIHQYAVKMKLDKNEIVKEIPFDTIKARIEFANLKHNELTYCLKEKVFFKTKHFSLEIQNKIKNINNIVLLIFKSDFSMLKVDTIIEIYFYLNYLKTIVWLKHYKIEKNLRLKQFFAKAFELNNSKILETLEFIKSQKNMLDNLLFSFCIKYNKYNPKYPYCRDNCNKYNAYKLFFALEKINDDFNDMNFCKRYIKKHELSMVSLCNALLSELECFDFSSIESLNNRFNFFKILCFLFLKLRSLYLCKPHASFIIFKDVFYKFICELIFKLNLILNNKKDMDFNMEAKKNFLIVILENLKETKKIINSKINCLSETSEHTKKTNILIPILKLYVYLYEIANKSILDKNNIHLYHEQYKIKKCEKPKKIWQKRWLELEISE